MTLETLLTAIQTATPQEAQEHIRTFLHDFIGPEKPLNKTVDGIMMNPYVAMENSWIAGLHQKADGLCTTNQGKESDAQSKSKDTD